MKGVWWGGAEDWEAADDDEVESGELGARPPFNFATLERVFFITYIFGTTPLPLDDDSVCHGRAIVCQ